MVLCGGVWDSLPAGCVVADGRYCVEQLKLAARLTSPLPL